MSRPAILLGFVACTLASSAFAQTIDPFYKNYTLVDLGTPQGIPPSFGGLTFKAGDPNTLLIGGGANAALGAIYAIEVERDCGNHVSGFVGSAKLFATAPNIDGGLVYGPDDVLFATTYPNNRNLQFKPGSAAPDRNIDLTRLDVFASTGTLMFVPEGFAGAGNLKIASFTAGTWYDAQVAPDGNGTFDIVNVTLRTTIIGGPEGIIYVAAGNPQFAADSVLVCDWNIGRVSSYEIDGGGDPIPATRRDFVVGLNGAEGATVDPLTNDFLFVTFGGGNHLVVVHGFIDPEPCDADFNGDGAVGPFDLATLLSSWGSCPNCAADLVADCVVGPGDLGQLLALWGQCKP